MTTLIPAPKASSVPQSRQREATLALARFEAVRLLRHPALGAGLALYVAYLSYYLATGGSGGFPVLQDQDQFTQPGMLALAMAAMLSANAAALRPHRHGTAAHFDVLALPPWRRTLALLLALIPASLAAAVLVALQFTFAALQPAAAGRASPAELATGPAVVLLLGAAGVLLARLVRSMMAAPLVVVGLLALEYVLLLTESGAAWLQPIRLPAAGMSLPANLVGRPAAWHLSYLLGLTVLFAVLAIMRSGGSGVLGKAMTAGAVAVTGTAAVFQWTAPSAPVKAARLQATERPAGMQECRRHGPTVYCAFPDFLAWAVDWDDVVRGVRALLPDGPAQRHLIIRQRVHALTSSLSLGWSEVPSAPVGSWAADDRTAGTPDPIPVGTSWGNIPRLRLAAAVAYKAVTGSTMRPHSPVVCDARGIVVMWLAVKATRGTQAGLQQLQAQSQGGGVVVNAIDDMDAGSINLRDRDFAVLKHLLVKPTAEGGQRVRAHWAELTSPKTSTERAAQLLGLPVPRKTAEDDQWNCG